MQIETHPLNLGFTWKPVTGPFRRITDAQAQSFNQLGYFVLEGVFDQNTLRALVAEIDPLEARVEALLRSQPDGKIFVARADEITFTVHLTKLSRRVHEFCSGPVFQDLANDLVGAGARLHWDQAVYKKPLARYEFPWHQDNGYTFVEPQQYLTCWVALTDATLDNGCPWIATGLHRFGTLRHWSTDRGLQCLDAQADAVPVPVRAGDILAFSSVTPHRSGPNFTKEVRKAYFVQFAPAGAQSISFDEETGERSFRPLFRN